MLKGKEVNMTKLQSWMMAGLAIVALAVGVVLASSAISSAQEGTGTPTPSPSASANDDSSSTPSASDDANDADDGSDSTEAEHGCAGGGKHEVKAAAAEVLGLSEDEVRQALRDGQSLAQLAEAQGMSVEDFRTALLENITADLQAKLDAGEITQEEFDEATADLNENLDDIINSEGGFHDRSGEDTDSDGTGTGFRAPFQRAPFGGGA